MYPTLQDTFSTHILGGTDIGFIWHKSNDVDSDVTYTLTLELEFFGSTYNSVHQNITDTTFAVSSNTLDDLLGGLNLDESELYWFVHSTDGEYTVVSDSGQFVLTRLYSGPTWHVSTTGSDDNDGSSSSPFATIQTAINTATNGDTVSVAAGTYTENIDFNGKDIVVKSLDGPYSVELSPFIDSVPIVWFHNNESQSAVLDGFIIKDGGNVRGSGIKSEGHSFPIIKNCIITNCSGESVIGLYYSGATFINCTIHNNPSNVFFFDPGNYDPQIINCTIVNNNGVGQNSKTYVPKYINSLLYGNNVVGDLGNVDITYSLVEGGWPGEGNIDANPLFVDATNGDYHLSDYSPCIGAGLDTNIVDTTDINGNPRPNPANSNPDMGAYENALGAPAEHIVITNDSLVVLEDSSSTIDLLDNDLILNITSFTSAIVDSADNGTIALVGDTALTYTPDENFFGYDTLSYRVFSSEAADTGLVLFTITAVNDAPVIVTTISDTTVDEDSDSVMLADLDVVFNDVDSDLTLSYTNDNTGLLTVNVDGDNAVTLAFTTDSSGTANLTLIADDGEYTITDSIVVTVNPVNDAPGIVLPDTIFSNEDGLLAVDFTPYFNDIDSDTSLVLTADGNVYINVVIDTFLVTFTADTNWNGFEDIVFTIDDQNLRFTDSDTVRVTVLAVNDAPIITAIDSVTIAEDSSAAVNLFATDVDEDSLEFAVSSDTSAVIADVNGSTLTLTPEANWNGMANISAIVSDGDLSDTTSFVLSITPVNDAPVFALTDTTINEGETIDIILLAVDFDDDELTYSGSSDTNAVIVSLIEDTLSVSLVDNWNGSSVITVVVTDESSTSDTADFILTVNPVNDSPEEFSVIYPTVSDTFSTHADNDTLIQFTWGKSSDIDSEINYTLTIELEFFGNVYTDIHEDISDTTIGISSHSLDPILEVVSQDEAVFIYYVHASDEEYTVSDTGEFVLSREALGIDDDAGIPEVFALHRNYPNPFNPITTLRYDLSEKANVNIIIYDMLGRQVRTLINQTQDAGFKSVIWDATNDYGKPVSAGVYLYQIQAGEFVQTRKMVLLK